MSRSVDGTTHGVSDKRTSGYRTRVTSTVRRERRPQRRATRRGHAHCNNFCHEVDTPDLEMRKLRALESVGSRRCAGSRGSLRGVQLRGVADPTAEAPGGQHAALQRCRCLGNQPRAASSRGAAAELCDRPHRSCRVADRHCVAPRTAHTVSAPRAFSMRCRRRSRPQRSSFVLVWRACRAEAPA